MENEFEKVKVAIATEVVAELEKVQPEVDKNGEYTLLQVVKWLMPWKDKTDGEETIGRWEMSLPIQMMMNLLKMWLTPEGQAKVEKVLHYYHPIDRAALAYALVLYMVTGFDRMHIKSALARRHYNVLCKELRNDMAELYFSDHLKRMMQRYGKKNPRKPKKKQIK